MYAVIRVRGRTGIKPQIKRAMDLLNLTRVNHCVFVRETPQCKGMLQKCKDYVTWGEVSQDVLAKVIERRGRLPGDKRVTLDYLKERGYDGFDKLANAVMEGSVGFDDLGMKKVFRLHPPRGGYKVIKQPYTKGALGYRGDAINALLRKMM